MLYYVLNTLAKVSTAICVQFEFNYCSFIFYNKLM